MQQHNRCRITGATIIGVEAHLVTVEVVVTRGMPGMAIVGMPDAAINESRERVRAALHACGFELPRSKIVINLAPSSLKKTGSGFDLPIALGLLAATGQINQRYVEGALVCGELALDGDIRPIQGMLAYQACAYHRRLALLCAPSDELVPTYGHTEIRTVRNLKDFQTGNFSKPVNKHAPHTELLDFADVCGHETAKRAMAIAAAGNHGILMIGPPGSGKTMLAKRLPSILPPLNEDQRFESAQIYSIAGVDPTPILAGYPPFRAPHHSASMAGLCGGGSPIRPGEVTLAHNGVLFLDELAEFSGHVLQSIRQPLESGSITITRADGNVCMPSRFMLVGATNPCPCGYFGDDSHECMCSMTRIASYQGRIGGPLIDRIDMCIDVWRSDVSSVMHTKSETTSEVLRTCVKEALSFRQERIERYGIRRAKSVKDLVDACRMSDQTNEYFQSASKAALLSGRGIMRTLSLARTIADIETSIQVETAHIAEAMSLRVRSSIGRQG